MLKKSEYKYLTINLMVIGIRNNSNTKETIKIGTEINEIKVESLI